MSRGPVLPQIIALAMMVAALVAVILLKGQCSRSVGGFFETIDPPAQQRGQSTPPSPPASP